MPTHESWLEDGIIAIIWTQPLTSDEVYQCFLNLSAIIDASAQKIHLLFDITDAGSLPVNTPVLAIRSRLMIKAHSGRIAVIGESILSKKLADVATQITKKEISFFPNIQDALNYLREPDY